MFTKIRHRIPKRKQVVSQITTCNSPANQSRRYDFKTYNQIKLHNIILNMKDGFHYRIFEKTKGFRLYENADGQDCELLIEQMKGEKVNGAIHRFPNFYSKIKSKEYDNVCTFQKDTIHLENKYLILDTTKSDYYYYSDKLNVGDITIADNHQTFLVVDFVHQLSYGMGYGGGYTYDNSYYNLVEINSNHKPITNEERKPITNEKRKPITNEKIKLCYNDMIKEIIIFKYPVLLSESNEL
jgi:hypothetical protein